MFGVPNMSNIWHLAHLRELIIVLLEKILNTHQTNQIKEKKILRVCLDRTYFAETENLLLKSL